MFKLPEDITTLTVDELNELHAEAVAAAKELASIDPTEITDAQIDELEAAVAGRDAVATQITEVEAAAEARTARLAALQEAAAEEPVVEEEPAAEPTDDPENEIVVPDDASELIDQEQTVTASVARAGRIAPKPKAPAPVAAVVKPTVSMVASAGVSGYEAGQKLTDFRELAEAFQARGKGFSGGASSTKGQKMLAPDVFGLSKDASRHSVAKIHKPESEFSTGMDRTLDEQMETIMEAAKESRLPGGSLVAAGGWCAPSENWYGGWTEWETVTGILDIPEVQANRGGINFSKGPDYAAIAANANMGFYQTEAQAIAGTAKACFSIDCPPFTEVRLAAIGFCVTAPVLTNAAYPELISRVLQIAAVAHQHKVNARVIASIQTALGAAINHTEIGSTVADVLDALSVQVTRLRYVYSLAPNATVEAVLPIWAKEIFRSDLSRRTGVDMLAVTDAQIQSFLSVRGIAAQWVYDYQPFNATNSSTWTSWPDDLEIMLYPAGAFVKLTTQVIDLDTIYDSVGLGTNVYTAAFFEEGLAVANTVGSGVKVTINIPNLQGRTGAANVGNVPTGGTGTQVTP